VARSLLCRVPISKFHWQRSDRFFSGNNFAAKISPLCGPEQSLARGVLLTERSNQLPQTCHVSRHWPAAVAERWNWEPAQTLQYVSKVSRPWRWRAQEPTKPSKDSLPAKPEQAQLAKSSSSPPATSRPAPLIPLIKREAPINSSPLTVHNARSGGHLACGN